jgi:hypothetical protein
MLKVISILENKVVLSEYLLNLLTKKGRLSISKHKQMFKLLSYSALFCQKILNDYQITLKELKYILDNNLTEINKVCINCGKPLNNINQKYDNRL